MRSTLIGPLSVGYRLELQMCYNFYREYNIFHRVSTMHIIFSVTNPSIHLWSILKL